MCKYCKVDDMGDSVSVPIIQRKQHLFLTMLRAEIKIYGNRINFNIDTQNDTILDVFKEIKFCPMCGRKLEVQHDNDK